MTAGIARILDEDFRERSRHGPTRPAHRPPRIHVVDRDPVLRDQSVQRSMVAAGRAESQGPESLGKAAGREDCLAYLLLAISWRPGHMRTLVRTPDGKARVLQGFYEAGEP